MKQMNKAFPDRGWKFAHAEWVLNKYGTVDPFRESEGRESLGSTEPSDDFKKIIKDTFDQYDVDQSGFIDMVNYCIFARQSGFTQCACSGSYAKRLNQWECQK